MNIRMANTSSLNNFKEACVTESHHTLCNSSQGQNISLQRQELLYPQTPRGPTAAKQMHVVS